MTLTWKKAERDLQLILQCAETECKDGGPAAWKIIMKITNIMKYASPRALLTLAAAWMLVLGFTKEAKAQVSCQIKDGGMRAESLNVSTVLTTGTNVAGRTFNYNSYTPPFDWSLYCFGSETDIIYMKPVMNNNLPESGKDGSWTYYRVDDYFSLGFAVSDCSGTWHAPFQPVPIFSCQNEPSTIKRLKGFIYVQNYFGWGPADRLLIKRDRTTWIVRLRVERAFSGPRNVNFPNIFSIYLGDTRTPESTLQNISITGTITVPESCTINAGQVIQVDFGNVGAGQFETAGQKPSGYTPVTTTAPVTCNDAAAVRNVKVSLAATAAPGMSSAIRTSNPDVGIVVQDINDRTVRPNVDTLPLRLTSTGGGRNEGTVTMKAFPVSTTGKKPSIGNFTATAAITVTFD
ncbi:TPA: fimbrial protein [Enterobacter asburiae]|nr:fimbrial protein [Enterobacter asburiae]